MLKGMTLDDRDSKLVRPDRHLLRRLESRQRKVCLPPLPRRSPTASVPPASSLLQGSAPPQRQPQSAAKSKRNHFTKQARTFPGMGVQISPRVREGGFVNPWHDHKVAPPLPHFAVRALRARMNLDSAVQAARAEHFSQEELHFFSVGDELATIAPPDDKEEESLRWWQRLGNLNR